MMLAWWAEHRIVHSRKAVERNLDSRWWRTAGLKETSKFRLHFLCVCAGQLASVESTHRSGSRFISGLAARLGLLRVEAGQSSYVCAR